MDDNKLFAIIFVAAICVLGATAIFGDSDEKAKEKTKQLILQYKIDSLGAIKKDTLRK